MKIDRLINKEVLILNKGEEQMSIEELVSWEMVKWSPELRAKVIDFYMKHCKSNSLETLLELVIWIREDVELEIEENN